MSFNLPLPKRPQFYRMQLYSGTPDVGGVVVDHLFSDFRYVDIFRSHLRSTVHNILINFAFVTINA